MIPNTPSLATSFTSTGEKLYFHQTAMESLRNGQGYPISAWCAPTDVCNAKCSFCSVGERPGDVLPWPKVKSFIDQLCERGLKSIVFSGGGNFLLYRCKETGRECNGVIDYCHDEKGLECALITNGMPMVEFWQKENRPVWFQSPRKSWKNMSPTTLDKLTWCRISMAGLDANHKEQEVYVPDFDPSKTSLGFSWIMSDSYEEPSHKHGWVSTPEDIRTEMPNRRVVLANDRLPWIEEQIKGYVEKHNPAYVRLLCNCLQPDLIPERHRQLSEIAGRINPDVVFSQFKPPRQPGKCYKVYTRPCLNANGVVFCCDSVVLNKSAGHKFGSEWGVCKWNEIGDLLDQKIRQVIPDTICEGCVFADQVDLLAAIVENGMATPLPEGEPPQHVNFV